LTHYSSEYDKHDLAIDEEALEHLVVYDWPGNVRQLASEICRIVVFAESGETIGPAQLSPSIGAHPNEGHSAGRLLAVNEVAIRLDQPLGAAIEHLERALLQHALRQCEGRLEETAASLGLSRKGLYLKRQRYGLNYPSDGWSGLD
jgi:DNA-binding NtrC family response regulator